MKHVSKCLIKIAGLFMVVFVTTARANDSSHAWLSSLKETFVYATKDSSVLRVDKYTLTDHRARRPCIFFLFGGSFRGGRRDNPAYFSYFEALVRKGYVVLSIDYRLGLKNINKFTGDGSALEKAIKMSEEDLLDATAFMLKHASAWNIDTAATVITGSSAGALTVLRTAYDRQNNNMASNQMAARFRYAGVIAFAGAIFSADQPDLVWDKNKCCPVMLFHGDMDKVVPYENFTLGNSGIFGAKYISAKLDSLHSPYWLYTVENGGHEVANTPMNENHSEIFKFLEDMVLNKKQIRVQTSSRRLDSERNEARPTLADFIKNNFLAR